MEALLFKPTLGVVLRDRRLSLVVFGAASLQMLLTVGRFPGWPCPIFHAFGIPCPGCGLTRATLFLVRGDLKQALTLHAFAPIFIVALGLIAFSAIAPRKQIDWVAA